MEGLRHNRRRGAALMLSLWALFLLSAMVISWAVNIDARIIMSGHANRNLEALAMACSGVEVAMSPNAKPGLPALEGGFGKDQRYQARITGEGGRININWVIASAMVNPDPTEPHRELLRKYLEIKGVELNDRDRMIDTLLDWVDADNAVRLNGAEDEAGYKPPNKGKLDRIEELKKIKGWEEFTSAKDWDADLTLQSGTPQNAPIEIQWASKDVLMSLPGASEDRVDQFLSMRAGGDEIDGTEDDPFMQPGGNGQAGSFLQDQALAVLGLDTRRDPQLASLIAPNQQVWRVTSVGKSGDATRTVRAVFQKGGQLKSWKEF